MPSLPVDIGALEARIRLGSPTSTGSHGDVGRDDVRSAEKVLDDSARMICGAIGGAIAELPTRVRSVVEYHFGFRTGSAPRKYEGKAVRAALAILSCEALGGDASQALGTAVCVELLHNGSLLQDDVIDADEQRRGRPAAWVPFGMPAAMLAGDALFFLALRVAGTTGTGISADCVEAVTNAFMYVIEGEYLDTLLEGRITATVSEVEAMAAGKTGALVALACSLGGAAAGADAGQQRQLSAFGRHLGIAFQYVDDVLGLWGDSARTGKPCGGDLRARKMSLPVAYVLASDTEAADVVSAAYKSPEALSNNDYAEIVTAIEVAGARSWALARAERHITDALAHLDSLDIQPSTRAELRALIHLLLNRNQ